MKKAFALILALALCMALLAACGSTSSSSSSSTSAGTSSGTSSSSSSSSSEPAAPSGEKTVVTVWCMHAEDEEPTKPYQRLLKWAEDYNANNTDNIEVVVSGAKTADVILTTVASGGTPDIFQNFWNNAPTWANNGALLDLTEYVNAEDAEWDKSDFVDSTWELCTYQDKIYSVPMTVSSTYLFYNKTMLADAGWTEFPKTMDELAQCIKDCTKVGDDGAIQQMGGGENAAALAGASRPTFTTNTATTRSNASWIRSARAPPTRIRCSLVRLRFVGRVTPQWPPWCRPRRKPIQRWAS